MRGYTGMPFWTANAIEEEIRTQLNSLRRLSIFDVKGWRSPSLKSQGDYQFRQLQSEKFLYDATLSTSNKNDGTKVWPYTLDFGWQHECVQSNCPKKKYPGLWEVPVVPVRDFLDKHDCDYVDGCTIPPSSANQTFNMLWQAFLKHYNTNKAPFGLNFRHIWFSHRFFDGNIRGIEMFLDKLGQMKDVYIVPVRDVLDWIQKPTPLSKIRSSSIWTCF